MSEKEITQLLSDSYPITEGYINSQSWEAWVDSITVFWENTELLLFASIALSLGAIFMTIFKLPKMDHSERDILDCSEKQSIQEEMCDKSLYPPKKKRKTFAELYKECSVPNDLQYNPFDGYTPKKISDEIVDEFESDFQNACSTTEVKQKKKSVRIIASDDPSENNKCPYSASESTDVSASKCPFPLIGMFGEDEPVGAPIPKATLITNEIQRRMSSDEQVEEQKTQADQLNSIFKIMEEQEEKFGNNSLTDIREQLKIYSSF